MSTFDDDLANAKKLLDALGIGHPKYLDAVTLHDRLKENISKANLYGDSSELSSDRSQIRRELNRISVDELKVTAEMIGAIQRIEHLEQELTAPQTQKTMEINAKKKNGRLVFISHSSNDKPFVDRLEQDMVKAGLQTWYDNNDIRVSQSIPGEISSGLAECKYFLVVLTPDSVASHWVLQEIDAALMGKKVITPVVLKTCAIPALLQAYKYADFRTDYQSGLTALFDGLGVQRDKNTAAKTLKNKLENMPGLAFIFDATERMRYNGDLTPDQGLQLKALFSDVAMKKQKGENPMMPANPGSPREMFSYASQILTYDLLSLSDYRTEWPHLIVSDGVKKDSVRLLGKMKDQVLVSSALMRQTSNLDYTDEIEQLLQPINSLQSLLNGIDEYLLSGNVPFNVKNEIERNFDDLTYHLNKYLLLLHELASSSGWRIQ